MRLSILLCSLALPLTAHVRAEEALPPVTVNAGKVEQRRNDTDAAIVVGHEELISQGDRTLSEALKRLPGISIGAPAATGQGGQIQLRGLGQGYTLIMLDGVPVPPGFSLDALDPELVERVEIMRAATAQFSAQAIAGSINIVLKKSGRRRERTFKLGASGSHGMPAGSATMQWADKDGRLSYALSGTLSHTGREVLLDEWNRAVDGEGRLTAVRHAPLTERVTSDTFELAPACNGRWRARTAWPGKAWSACAAWTAAARSWKRLIWALIPTIRTTTLPSARTAAACAAICTGCASWGREPASI